ncbi:MAG: hypothetical protein KC620_26235 [Myxococcales bacterium]|nr:hypothetical protein [Myxococcales bacterium]
MNDQELWASKVVEQGRRIAHLLRIDAEAFVERTVRERFIAIPTLADTMDDDALAELKQRTRATSVEIGEAIASALDREAVWLTAEASEPTTPVRSVPAVDAALTDVEASVKRLLDAEGLGDDEPVAYRLPVRFIDGDNLVTLTRNFWKNVARYQAALHAAAEQDASRGADTRRRRWDDA